MSKLSRSQLGYLLLLLTLLSLLQQGCGFRLRGEVELPAGLQQLQVSGVDAYSELGLALSRAWRDTGAELTFSPRENVPILKVSKQDFSRRVRAVDNAGRPTLYELKYELDFSLLDAAGNPQIQTQTVSLLRDYRFDPDNVLAKGDEEARIKRSMIQFAVSQMLRRIDFQFRRRAAEQGTVDETAR